MTLKGTENFSECKNRYAKHTCIKALVDGCNFLATCNAILLLVARCKIGKYTFAPCDRAFSA